MLRPAEERALQKGTGALLALGDDGRIGYASAGAQALLGWDDGLVGQPLSVIVPQRLHALFRSGFGHFVTTGGRDRPGSARIHRHPAKRRDGSEWPVQIHVRGFRRPDGSLFICAGLAVDPGPSPVLDPVALALAGHGYTRL